VLAVFHVLCSYDCKRKVLALEPAGRGGRKPLRTGALTRMKEPSEMNNYAPARFKDMHVWHKEHGSGIVVHWRTKPNRVVVWQVHFYTENVANQPEYEQKELFHMIALLQSKNERAREQAYDSFHD
jgi:hypothetical protein